MEEVDGTAKANKCLSLVLEKERRPKGKQLMRGPQAEGVDKEANCNQPSRNDHKGPVRQVEHIIHDEDNTDPFATFDMSNIELNPDLSITLNVEHSEAGGPVALTVHKSNMTGASSDEESGDIESTGLVPCDTNRCSFPVAHSSFDDVLSGLQSALEYKRSRMSWVYPRNRSPNKWLRSSDEHLWEAGNSGGAVTQIKMECWIGYLLQLRRRSPNVFKNYEALLKSEERVGKRHSAYTRLGVSYRSNCDILEVYRMAYEQKLLNDSTPGFYENNFCAVGQWLRLAVVCGKVGVMDICKPEVKFETMCPMDLMKAFLNYFETRASESTVLTKAIHLKKIVHFAQVHFQNHGNTTMAKKAKFAHNYLNSVFNAKKKVARRIATRKKHKDECIESCSVLFLSAFGKCL